MCQLNKIKLSFQLCKLVLSSLTKIKKYRVTTFND
jgi:hypothetical protein